MGADKMPKLVLVTGANGYIATMLIKELLQLGYKVRGTVRDPNNERKTAALRAFPESAENLELVPLELTSGDEGFERVMEGGVEWVMHTACPVVLNNSVDESEIIEPALEGTLGALRAAHKQSSVKAFVLTSSIASIVGAHDKSRTKAFTEDDWSLLESPALKPYPKAKTLAEKAAWDFFKKEKPSFTFSVINPCVVVGPVASANVGSSTQLIASTLNPKLPFTVNSYFRLVDVRDVVQAHINAAKFKEASGKRFIITQSDGGEKSHAEIADTLRNEFGPMGYNVAHIRLPDVVVWLFSFCISKAADAYFFLGNRQKLDNSLSRDILKLEYTPIEKTLLDAGHSMIQYGAIPKKEGYRKAV